MSNDVHSKLIESYFPIFNRILEGMRKGWKVEIFYIYDQDPSFILKNYFADYVKTEKKIEILVITGLIGLVIVCLTDSNIEFNKDTFFDYAEQFMRSIGYVYDQTVVEKIFLISSTPIVSRKSICKSIRHEVFKRDDYRCLECGATNKESTLHIDHIIPVSQGGSNEIDNLQTLCARCNLGKHNGTWIGGAK
jgi:hypothetical protein